MKIKFIIHFFILFLLSACQSKQGVSLSSSTKYVWNEDNKASIYDSFDTIQYIILEENPQAYLQQIDKLIVQDGKIFVFDRLGRNQVVVFDTTGKFLYGVGRKGRGPGEFIRICNFTVDSNYIYIIHDIEPSIMYHSVKDGSFIKKKRISFFPSDIAVFKNGDFAFTLPFSPATPSPQNKIVITDNQLNIKKYLFPLTPQDNEIINKLSPFLYTDQSVIFNSYYSDTLIIFDRVNPDSYETVCIDFGKYQIPLSYRKKENLDNDSWLYINENVVANSSFLFGRFGKQFYLYDRKKQSASPTEPNGFYTYTRVHYATDNYFLSSFFNRYNVYLSLVDKGMQRAPLCIEEQMEQGNCVLIKYVLK
ncbi:6-bladed beta-propeller [Odoribacter lunatus]|uniref:6-bladed beta-propeller n=1 Tax=Odoribacter lunatus TaxID=2941335 RepID=UPI00203C2646|nr:6-bladed beta-propeller [Odoribacter lunatus]